jgi:hypothetical protein
VYVFSAIVLAPYVTAHLSTLAQVEQGVTTQSTINPDGSYVVPATIGIDGLSPTPAKQGLLPTLRRKYELLHFGYVTQWETFRRDDIYTHQVLCHEDTALPKQCLFYSRFTSFDFVHVWMIIRGYINLLCGRTPTDLRRETSFPTTNFAGLPVTLTKIIRKAAINSKFKFGREPRELKDWLEAQSQRFVMLGFIADSYDTVIWVT